MSTTQRTCPNGHVYHKSSDCPTCPKCEQEKRAADEWFSSLSAPALRALKREGIETPKELSEWSKKALLSLHGLGPSSIPKLEKILADNQLEFKA